MIKKLFNNVISASNNLIRRHLEFIYEITISRPVFVFVACCIVFTLSCLSISRIHFESDIFKLFPQKGPLALFLDTMKWTGSAGNAYFLLEGDKEKLVKEAEVFAGKLQRLSVEGSPAFNKIKYRVFDPAEATSFAEFLNYAVTRPQLFLSPADVESYLKLLKPETVDSSIRQAQAELSAPGSFTDIIAADPLYLRNLILPRLKTASEALDLDTSSPYFLSRDGKVLIIIGEPSRPVTDIAFARKLVEGINEARKGASVNISCAGAHLSAVTDESIIKENVVAGLLSTLVIVLALYYVSYRRILPTLLIPIILLYGVVLTVGTAGFIYPTISIISFAFTSLLVGLSTDYSIHLYDRFHFERSRGKSSDESLRLSIMDTGYAIFTAAATTSIPFLAFLISDVRALTELGLLVGLGVMFSLYATLFFLPPLLIFMEKRFPLKEYKPLPSFGLEFLWRAGQRYWRTNIALSVVITVCMVLASSGTSFESDLKNLQPRSSEAFLSQEKVEQHLSVSPKQLIVAVESNDFLKLLSQGSKIDVIAQKFWKRGEIVSFSSVGQVINYDTAQQKVIESLSHGFGNIDVGTAVKQALVQQGFNTEPFQDYINNLSNIKNTKPLLLSDGIAHLSDSPFRGIVERHLIHNASGYHLLTYINYRDPEFGQKAFLDELQQAVPEARATSVDLISKQLIESVSQSFIFITVMGSIMVIFLLMSHFNAPEGIFYSLFPVSCGTIAMLGLMALSNMRLNFMNVMVLVTILGMGSDYGLHIGHRVMNCNDEEHMGRYVQSSRAVLLSAISAIAGFGSLAFTDYGALASIGWATIFGISATTIFTLVTLPAFIRFFQKKRVTSI